MTEQPEIIVLPDAASAAAAAADRIAVAIREAADARGVAHWMTTGGSNPTDIYRRLASRPLRDDVPWQAVNIWFTDERLVPRDHPFANVKQLDDVLINLGGSSSGSLRGGGGEPGVPIPVAQLHPFRTAEAIGQGRGADSVAQMMIDELAAAELELRDGFPVMDLVLLGLGGDGHLLSVFPGSPAFDSKAWAMPIPAPTHIEPHVERVTMHPSIIAAARTVLMVVTGEGKTDALTHVLSGDGDVRRWPGQVAAIGSATWLLDAAAAGGHWS